MTTYFHDNCGKLSPARTNIHLQFTNRICRNLNNANEEVIKVLLSVLNMERPQVRSSHITFNRASQGNELHVQ